MAARISKDYLPWYAQLREVVGQQDGSAAHPMALIFDSAMGSRPGQQAGTPAPGDGWAPKLAENITRPADDAALCFMPVLEIAALVKTKQISSVELTTIFLKRAKEMDTFLEAVICFTEELGMQQAEAADRLLAQGTYLGPLHGIPYGLKDTAAVPGYPTTWGCVPFEHQVIEEESHVYTRLKAAGAVLIAKLSTGEMAYYDVWHGGFTKNPWNLLEGASGSSAGSASALAAGMVPFAIGTETCGSITSPASQCGVTGLRPSFGAVGRSGVMALAPSLDKVGTFARTAADAAVVLDAIRGRDPRDPSSFDSPLKGPFGPGSGLDATTLAVGYVEDKDWDCQQVFKELGIKTVPVTLKSSPLAKAAISIILDVETAAHFDNWQRSGCDAQNRRQDLWPPHLRTARLIPGVEYVQATRARGLVIKELETFFLENKIDAFLGSPLFLAYDGNLVGLPEIVVPTGFVPVEGTEGPRRDPRTMGIYAKPDQDGTVLALAAAFQSVTKHHLMQPPIDKVESDVVDKALKLKYSRAWLAEQVQTSTVTAPSTPPRASQ
eukprot:jgi/Astpho2/6380/e_gw1.00091.15.1_t